MKPFNSYKLNWYNSLIVIIGFFFLSLTFYKASHSAFTHDESFTYLSYVKKSIIGIVTLEEPISANNHILNTLGMKAIDKILSPTPFNLRLPNIFAHLLFILFSAFLVSNLKNDFFKMISFILLNSNIYLIDFFSLARGYGFSLGFLMIHWYFLVKILNKDNENRNFILMLLSLFIAMYTNFSLIYYGAAFLFIYSIFELKNKANLGKRFTSNIVFRFKYLIGFFAVSVTVFYIPISKLLMSNQFYFGGSKNFFDDTIYSLVYFSTESIGLNEKIIYNIYVVVMIILFALLIYFGVCIIRKKFLSTTNAFIGILFTVVMIQVLFFYFFNSKYLIQRTAIFLIPLFTLGIINLINDLDVYPVYILSGFIGLFMLLSVIRFTPFENSINWRYDADNEQLLKDLNSIYNNSDRTKKISLGIDWIFQPSLNFYRATSTAGVWLDTLTKEGYQNKQYNFYFVESSNFINFVDSAKYKVIKKYYRSNNLLIKNLKIE